MKTHTHLQYVRPPQTCSTSARCSLHHRNIYAELISDEQTLQRNEQQDPPQKKQAKVEDGGGGTMRDEGRPGETDREGGTEINSKRQKLRKTKRERRRKVKVMR